MKNKLTITIYNDEEETEIETEEEFQSNQIKEKANFILEEDSKNNFNNYLLEKDIDLTKTNINFKGLLNYMEGKNNDNDLSYMWINTFDSVFSLSKSITFSPKSWENFFKSRNFEDEFKVSSIEI
jgi:hypothetical protein